MAREKLTEEYGTPSVRLLPEEAYIQMVGSRQGLIHAMLQVGRERQRYDMEANRLPRHHTAKRRAAQAKADLLRSQEASLDEKQKACGVAIRGSEALKRGNRLLALQSKGPSNG